MGGVGKSVQLIVHTLIISAIIGGCSTANKEAFPPDMALLPPDMASWPINQQLSGNRDFESIDLFLNRTAKENPTPNVIWWADYRRAQLWSKKDAQVACENFSRLSADPQFPIRRLAYLRAHEVCPESNQILKRLDAFNISSFDSWLSEAALDVAIKKAEAINKRRELVDLYIRKSKLNLRKEEKVNWTTKALALAKKLKDADKVKEIEKRLFQLSPSKKPSPKKSDYLAIASDFRYLRDFDNARKWYEMIIKEPKLPVSDKIQALRGIRMTYKVQQEREKAILASERLAQFVEKYLKASRKTKADYLLYEDNQLLYVRSLWTENQTTKALKELAKAEKTLKGKVSLAEVYWIKARMAEEKGDFKQAADFLETALAESVDSKSLKQKLRWYMAWNVSKIGDPAKAQKLFQELIQAADNPYDQNKFRFWLSRSYLSSDKMDEAKDELEAIIKEDPLSYYGLLAHRELKIPLPGPVIRKAEEEDQKQVELTKELKAVVDQKYLEWLFAVKEEKVAKDYLNSIAEKLKSSKETDKETWITLLKLYAKSNNYLALFGVLNGFDTALRRSIIETYPTLIFPRPYFETVSASATRFGISPEFIYSIMRQESSFNPQARSQMDAFGLMQVLPEVARKSANANNIEFSNEDDLYNPQINIPIGSAHLRELWDRYNGEIILAVASYNASEKAILNWLNTRFRGDATEFIEDIPYDETRDYVKLVLRNFVTYQILIEKNDQPLFPEWTLKISQHKDIE